MRSELPTDRMHPAVKIYKLKADMFPVEPEFIHFSDTDDDSYNDPRVLIVVGGLADKRTIDTAVDLARERKSDSITVAVMTVDQVSREIEEDFCCDQLKELKQAFDSVFLINEQETDDFVKLIAHAIIIPGSPGQHIGCDWNDMRTIVGGEKSSRLGRYGVGQGRGEARASQAVQAALSQLNQQEHGLNLMPTTDANSMNNEILKIENTKPIRHNIIALGKLSPLLETDFHQLAHCNDELETKTHWIKDADTNPTNLPDALLAGKIDYTWIFINEPEILKPSVLNAILQSSQVSPIFIECYCDQLMIDAEPMCELRKYTRSITGLYKIRFSHYPTDPFRSLRKHRGIHWIDQVDVETPIFYGEAARVNDPLYPKARAIVLEHRRGSLALVQRHLRIGYNHSSRLLDAMVGDILTEQNVDGLYSFIE